MTFLAEECISGVEEAAVEGLWLNFRSTEYQSMEVKLVVAMTKNTFRDGGSTPRFTLFTLFILFKLLYTA